MKVTNINSIVIPLLIVCSVITSSVAKAQQDPQFTHYMYNTIHVNPAYAGSRDLLTVGILHRSQWIGLDGAPSSQTFYIHSPLRNQNINLGLSAVNDKIGPIASTSFFVDFAYRIKLSKKAKLAFGLKAGLNLFQPKLAEVETDEPGDQAFVASTLTKTIAPNFGFGIYLNKENWYLGVSTPKLVENKLNTGDTTAIGEKRHFFFIAGFVLPISDAIKLKPTLQTKMVENAPLSIDFTTEALIHDIVSFGIGYRLYDAFSALAGVQISPQWKVGMSYDFTTSQLKTVNSGSLELMLMYDFNFRSDKLKSPRYF